MIGRLRSKSKMATTSLNYVEFSRNTRITNNFNTSIFSRCGFSSFARFFLLHHNKKHIQLFIIMLKSYIFRAHAVCSCVRVFYSLNFLSCRQGRAEWFTFGSLMHMRVFHEIFCFILFYFFGFILCFSSYLYVLYILHMFFSHSWRVKQMEIKN